MYVQPIENGKFHRSNYLILISVLAMSLQNVLVPYIPEKIRFLFGFIPEKNKISKIGTQRCLINGYTGLSIMHVKFIYSEKDTKFCEIFTLLVVPVKSKVKISQNFMNFKNDCG